MKFPHLQYPYTQVVYFDNGERRTLRNVTWIEEGKWTHIICDDGHGGSETIINPDRVLFIRIVSTEKLSKEKQ